jgi:hypothetical protein
MLGTVEWAAFKFVFFFLLESFKENYKELFRVGNLIAKE